MKKTFIQIVKDVLPRRKFIHRHENCIMYELSGAELLTMHDKFTIPSYQVEINRTKVNAMQRDFFTNHDFFHLKNNIVFGVLPYNEETIYIIDGQHRFDMLKQLQSNLSSFITNQDFKFNVYFFNIINDEYQLSLFRELNHDSYKNQEFISLGATIGKRVYDVCELLKQHYVFSPKRAFRENDKIYTLKEFMHKIHPYLLTKNNAEEVVDDIHAKLKLFKEHVDWFTVKPEEEEYYKRGSWLSLTRLNFVEFLLHDTVPNVIPLPSKRMITGALRKKVWDREFGIQMEAKCPIKNCTSMLFKEQDSAFHCGHIVPKCRGGEDMVENLRPICANCNARMGCRHWDEYEKNIV
jgi:hypothetical protein